MFLFLMTRERRVLPEERRKKSKDHDLDQGLVVEDGEVE
jgi:hypothetical protein